MCAQKKRLELQVGDRTVSLSSPDKVYFPAAGITKLELAQYYMAVAEGALRGAGNRPNVMKRYVNGIDEEFFFQKRAPKTRPEWLDTAVLRFPSGRQAEEVVPRDAAALVWMAQMGCVDLNPHAVRAEDLDHPDELRIDLDPVRGVEWAQVCEVAAVVREALAAFGLVGWPKTSGSRGIHINVRIFARWTFDQVRRAALAFARDVELRAPRIATSAWWKEERHGVFLDYNQNAKDRTTASAYSVRPVPDARVSMPLTWEQILSSDPHEFTLRTVPAMFVRDGDAHSAIDEHPCTLDALLELSARHEAEGKGDAPWPPHYEKADGEPARVQPSRAKKKAKLPSQATTPTKAKAGAAKKRVASAGRREPKYPLATIAKAAKRADALAGLERWKQRHPDVAKYLEPSDILVDSMRGRHTTWTRIRVNLRHVPEEQRPPGEAPDPDYDPSAESPGS